MFPFLAKSLAFAACTALFSQALYTPSLKAESSERPNFVIIFTDDQGYNDLGCFGSPDIKTPNIDSLAAEGRTYTSFYVGSSVCSPSRAALLTGCYPKRVGMHQHVVFPQSKYGLNAQEHTIADHLKQQGYATACIGKWHLGHHPPTLPTSNGFDSYFGIPYSNDMNHPDNKRKTKMSLDQLWANQENCLTQWNTPLMENEEMIECPVDQRTITRRYTDKAIEFVKANQDKPFFLYLPHSMPHIPLYVPEDAYDADPQQAYKCVIEHIDTEVGRLIDTIRELDLAESTYVIYTSDNGPWLRMKNHGGCADPLRDGKGTTFEGGQRVPCVMWAPDRIPAGTTTNALTSTIDLLPTIAKLSGKPIENQTVPGGHRIDGFDISATFSRNASPRNEFVYYSSHGQLEGIRIGEWKVLEKRLSKKQKAQNDGIGDTETFLFHLSEDVGEQNNLADQEPERVKAMKARMQEIDQEITANARPVWGEPKR